MTRRIGRLLALFGALTLAGCGAGHQLPDVLFLTIGTNTDQTISAVLRQEMQERMGLVVQGYRQIHPDTHVQYSLVEETQMRATIRRRTQAGLGPDLIYLNGDTAVRLLQAGLVDPFPASASQLSDFDPEELQRLRTPDGRLAGLPVVVQTQLSCINRRRLPRTPTTLSELLAAGAAGHPLGLSVDLANLVWSAGSTGAIPALNRLALGQPISGADRSAIERWFTWLQNANSLQQVSFFADVQSVEAEFMAGRLAWMPCRSASLPHLRRAMGPALVVAPLPDGADGHRASPVNRLRVLALGRHSSARGRRRALAFALYSVNPLTQRTLTLGSQTVLPANRRVSVPVQSARTLKAMVTATEQGQQSNRLVALLNKEDGRMPAVQTLITALVFGEISPTAASAQLIQTLRPPVAGGSPER